MIGDPGSGEGAFIDAKGVFTLRFGPEQSRRLSLDFTEAADTAPCSTTSTCRRAFDLALVDVVDWLNVRPVTHSNTNVPGGFNGIPVGTASPAWMQVNFKDPNGGRYIFTLRFAPAAYAGSTFLSVSRIAPTEWIIKTPASPENRARLVAINQAGKLVTTDEGLYAMPFQLRVVQ